MDQMKPPFIAKLGFQRLTLGEEPVVLEGIRVITYDPVTGSSSFDRTVDQSFDRDLQRDTDRGSSSARGSSSSSTAAGGAGLTWSTGGFDQGGGVDQAGPSATANGGGSKGKGSERLEFEVDFVWQGLPNIAFFVEVALMG
jgi:hypothetical protein